MRVLKPEEEFQAQVLALARIRGWRCHAERPARTAKGWRTPIAGDPGWPDIVLVRGRSILVVELKVPPNRCTPAQLQWLDALARAGVATQIWTPEMWPEIERILE